MFPSVLLCYARKLHVSEGVRYGSDGALSNLVVAVWASVDQSRQQSHDGRWEYTYAIRLRRPSLHPLLSILELILVGRTDFQSEYSGHAK